MDFNTNIVCKLTGLTKRQIDYWDRIHFIKPSVREASEYGKFVQTFKRAGWLALGKQEW